jgi:hypothetical protein
MGESDMVNPLPSDRSMPGEGITGQHWSEAEAERIVREHGSTDCHVWTTGATFCKGTPEQKLCDGCQALADEIARAIRQAQRSYREVMQKVMQVLGPAPVCECAGCAWETGEAIRLLNEAGIVYQDRKRSVPSYAAAEAAAKEFGVTPEAVLEADKRHTEAAGPPHDPEAERRGNEIAKVDS